MTLLLAGCSEVDHGDRAPLSGTIYVNGMPLDANATIYFDPAEGQQGLGASGGVSDSKFTIPVESGLTPGLTYNVTVITSVGIPPEGTPLNEIKQSKTYVTQVEVPAAEANEEVELIIDIKSETPPRNSR